MQTHFSLKLFIYRNFANIMNLAYSVVNQEIKQWTYLHVLKVSNFGVVDTQWEAPSVSLPYLCFQIRV